jgi:hypothetical protein
MGFKTGPTANKNRFIKNEILLNIEFFTSRFNFDPMAPLQRLGLVVVAAAAHA